MESPVSRDDILNSSSNVGINLNVLVHPTSINHVYPLSPKLYL